MAGDVIVKLVTDRAERLAAGTVLQSARGPVEVVTSKPHQHRWIVTFKQIRGRAAAEDWRGVRLLAEPLDDPDALFVHQLIGATVCLVDDTTMGTVVSVEGNPASDLLVLDNDALVPMNFVVSFADGVVTVDPPDGLFDP